MHEYGSPQSNNEAWIAPDPEVVAAALSSQLNQEKDTEARPVVKDLDAATAFFKKGESNFDKVAYIRYEPIESGKYILTTKNVEPIIGHPYIHVLVDSQMPDIVIAAAMNKELLLNVPGEIINKAA